MDTANPYQVHDSTVKLVILDPLVSKWTDTEFSRAGSHQETE